MRLLKLGSALVCVLFLKLGATENTAEAACPEDSLPCDDGIQCFKRNIDWCDGNRDCQDGSDEAYCAKWGWIVGRDPNNCLDTHFLCNDGRCVPLVAKCDGYKDCSDASDEKKCEPEPTVEPEQTVQPEPTIEPEPTVKPEPTDDYDYDTITVATERSIFESSEEDITNPTFIPTPAAISIGTSDAPNPSSTIHEKIHGGEDEEVLNLASVPVSAHEIPVHASTTPMDFYKRREEEEKSQSGLQPPSSSVSSYVHPVTSETVYVPGAYQTQDARTTTTTSRPRLSNTISSIRSHHFSRSYDREQAPVTESYDSRSHVDRSSRTTTQPGTTSRQPDQWRTSSTHPTRSYVAFTDQHPRRDSYQPTQPPRTYDPRRGSYQQTRTYTPRRDSYDYQTQPTRSHDSRQNPNYYSTQSARSYDTRWNQHNTQPTSPYYSTRDPYYYQTQPTRPHGSRRDNYQYQTPGSVPTRYTYYPYRSPGELTILATTPGTRYQDVTHRIYLHHGFYYGYYDEQGRFVVLRTNGDDPQPSSEPIYVDYRNRQATRNPYPVDERYRPQPTFATPTPLAFTRQLKVPSRFHFSKNFAKIYENKSRLYLRKGKEFILSLRNSIGDWGVETPRALVALSLLNNSFVNDTYDNNMMQKYFQVFLGSSLLRGDTKTTTLSRLAMAIHGLLATCQNPRDFHGTDLTQLIRKQLHQMNQARIGTSQVNPSVYLSLCLANKELTNYDLHYIMMRLGAHYTPDEYSKDMLSLSIIAFSCHLQQQQDRDSDTFRSLESLLNNATSKLLDRMLDDGSFGSVYSTAISAQALLSVNDSKQWNADKTIDYLKQHQLEDGSFGDFLATYWTLPALSGRSLLHLRNTQCKPPKADRILTPSEIMDFTGPKQHIRYSLYIGYPNVNGNSLEVLVPHGISFFDIMRVAEHQNNAFKFSYEENKDLINVYSISNVPNDPERGFQWKLYVKRNDDPEQIKLNVKERVFGDIRDFHPRSDQHVIFWYHPSDINS